MWFQRLWFIIIGHERFVLTTTQLTNQLTNQLTDRPTD